MGALAKKTPPIHCVQKQKQQTQQLVTKQQQQLPDRRQLKMATPLLMLTFLIIVLIATWSETLVIQPPIVCSRHIGCMQGTYMPGYQIDSFEAFLGIPYAIPPIMELRFNNPKAYPKWSGIYNATEVKMDCIQKNYLLASPVVSGVEDCLYLNVYRPAHRSKQPLPVMVYIHGGGWFSGSASPEIHGPEYFMDTEKVILVTLAYRLGALGFLSTNDANMPGNFGLKDQNLALRWVQKNIASFGGNPKHVTLFGQSAGATSAHMHMLSKQSEGLFRNVIALSGTANVPFAITEDPLEQARKTAQLCNISNAMELSTAKLARALRQVDVLDLVNSGDGLKYWHVDHMTNFRPVIELPKSKDAFLTKHPRVLLETGNYKAVPFLVGSVPHEGAVRVLTILENDTLKTEFNKHFDELMEKLMEWPLSFNSTQLNTKMSQVIMEYFGGQHELNEKTWRGFLDIITDRGFHQPYFNTIRHHVNTINTKKYPIYLYKFNYKGPYSFSTIYTGGHNSHDYGVVHCDDLIYLFRAPKIFRDFEKNSTNAAVIEAFVGNMVHFAKWGMPENSQLREPCNKFTFNREPDTICDYQEFSNVVVDDGAAQSTAFHIKTDNKFNVKRMLLWNDMLEL